MNRVAALSLPVFLFAATTVAGAQEPVVRTYSVHDLVAPAPENFLLPVGPALPGDRSPEHLSGGGILVSQPYNPMELLDEPLWQWLREVWSEDQQAAGEIKGGVLTLRASPGTHARVHDLLSVLQSVMGRNVTLGIRVLPQEAAARESALLDAGAVETLLTDHSPLRSFEMGLRSDVPGLLENGRAVNVLRDYDVEVSKRSSISDPKTDIVFLGDRLGALATPMADGRFWLRWGWTSSHGELPFPRRALTGKGLGTLDLPVVDSSESRGTATLAPGEGILLGGTKQALLLVLEEVATPPFRTGSVAAVPLGPLVVPPLVPLQPSRLVHRPGTESHLFGRDSDYEAPDPYATLGTYLGKDLGEQLDLTVLGSHAIVTSQGLGQRVEALAREQAESVAAHGLCLVAGTLPVQDSRGSPDELARRLEGRESWVVTLPDQAFAVKSWTEHAFLRDYEVEIAERSAVANPVVGIAYDGWSVQGTVHRAATGLPTLSGSFQWSRLPPSTPRDTGIREIGSLDLPEVCYTEADLRATLRPGSWQVLHRGPDPLTPEERVLVLLVRAEQKG